MRAALRRLAALVAGLALVPAASAQERFEAPDGSYSFVVPAHWTVEPIGESRGVLLRAPWPEQGWQGSMYFQAGGGIGDATLARVVRGLAASLAESKRDFTLRRATEIRIAGDRAAGLIEFEHVHRGTALTDWEIVVPLADGRALFVGASTATALRQRYLPVFARVLEGMRLAER